MRHRRAESFAAARCGRSGRMTWSTAPSHTAILTAARRAPSPVRSCTTATFTARQHRGALELGPLARDASLALVEDPRQDDSGALFATSSGASRATTRMDTTASAVRRSWQSAAVRSSQGLDGALLQQGPQIICPRTRLQSGCSAKEHHSAPSAPTPRPAQKHGLPPSQAHRRALMHADRCRAVELAVKDPATIDVSKGWCRIMGLVPISLFPRLCPRRAQPPPSPMPSQSAHSKSRGEKPPARAEDEKAAQTEPQRSCWDDGQRLP